MRIRLLLIFTSFVIVSSGCGTPCTIGISDAPELRGFRLGMTDHEIVNKWPGLKEIKPDPHGISYVVFHQWSGLETTRPGIHQAERMIAAQDMKGAKRITLTLVDRRVAKIKVTYDSDVKWASETEFAKAASAGLGIAGDWETAESPQRLNCSGSLLLHAGIGPDYTFNFESALNRPSGPYLEMVDTSLFVQTIVRPYADQKNREQQKKGNFEP
jgi:hypothetical protein